MNTPNNPSQAKELERLTGWLPPEDPSLWSRMEQRMIETWVMRGRDWKAGEECRVCGSDVEQIEREPGEEGIVAAMDTGHVTICNSCKEIVADHYRDHQAESDATRWDRECPGLYRDILRGYINPPDVHMPSVRQLQDWRPDQGGIIILGPSGAGKTTGLWSIFQALEKSGINCDYWSAVELGKELSKCARDIESATHLTRKAVLMIDDFGKERITQSSASMWWELINRRYEGKLPVVITTRYKGEEFESRIGEKGDPVIAHDIRRRLRDMTNILDARKAAPWAWLTGPNKPG